MIKFKRNLQQLDIGTIAVIMEISLLMLVILGRWFLPKGNISRSTLSQLLLVYMSLASDIVDLLSLLNETQVQESSTMPYFTLAIFSWSLFQFSLNLVVTRGRSFQSITLDDEELEDEEDMEDENASKSLYEKLHLYAIKGKEATKSNNGSKKCANKKCFRLDMLDTEMWSILITLVFQDGPFFVLRITAVFKYDVRTFVTMFFTCKNAIILFLQIYRLSAICTEAKNGESDTMASNKADAISSLNSAASSLDKFVVSSYTQNFLIKKSNDKTTSSQHIIQEMDKQLLSMSPIILKSTLSRLYSYAVVLTPNYNLTVSCCECDCHLRDNSNIP